MPERMTQEEFEARLAKYGVVKAIGEYKGFYNPIKCQCLFCGKEWTTKTEVVLKGCGCPDCGFKKATTKKTMTHERFVSIMAEKNPDVEVMGNYHNTHTKIRVKCKKCNCEWDATPNNLTTKSLGCPNCRYDKVAFKLKKSRGDFVKELAEIHPSIKLVGEYKNNKTKTKFKCLRCKSEWFANPNSVIGIRRTGCPHCNSSKGEKKVEEYLQLNNYNYKTQYSFLELGRKKFDFAVFDDSNNLLCLIEYDGEQHFEPVDFGNKGKEWALNQFEQTQKRDREKDVFCKKNNIKLIRIPYFENVNAVLNSKLGEAT